MSNEIMEFIGERPSNPLIYEGDKWAYYLDNIVELEPHEDMPDVKRWQAELIERVPLAEYYRRERERLATDMTLVEARCNTTAYELILMGGL